MAKPLNILAINGSGQDPSWNSKALAVAAQGAKIEGAAVEVLELRGANLPLFRGYQEDVKYTAEERAHIQFVVEKVEAADGYLIASPEYHHAMTATLKNFFEHLAPAQTADKVVGLLGATTGQFGTIRSQASMYSMFRTFKLWLVPDEVLVTRAQELWDDAGKMTDHDMEERLLNLGRKTAKYVQLLKGART